jgi:hypothetical protein
VFLIAGLDRPRGNGGYGRSEFRSQYTSRGGAIEHAGTGGAELQLTSDKAGDNPALIGNILLAKPHDIWRARRLILLRLSECRTRA